MFMLIPLYKRLVLMIIREQLYRMHTRLRHPSSSCEIKHLSFHQPEFRVILSVISQNDGPTLERQQQASPEAQLDEAGL